MELPIVSALEFDQVRSSIKNYIKSKSDFTDYNFEGSNLSMLVDILAYNTLYTTYNVNMAANELNLDTAVLRDNIVSISKRLGYTPNSYTSARVSLNITIETTNSSFDNYDFIRIEPGSVLTSSFNGRNYSFILRDKLETSVKPSDNSVIFSNVEIFEGSELTISYIVDETNENQRFFIPNNAVDVESVRVSVISDPTNQVEIDYTKKNTIVDVSSSDEVFFVEEVQDQKYEVIFGDDAIGRKVRSGEIVKIKYMTTSGPEANGISNFKFSGSVRGVPPTGPSVAVEYDNISYSLITKKSDRGSVFESSRSIKFRAPRSYAAQDRAVTISDYESVIQRIYPNTDVVKVIGGEDLNPPRFGEIFISILPIVGDKVSVSEKDRILTELKKFKVGSVSVNIIDPDQFKIIIRPVIVYDSSLTRNRVSELESEVNEVVSNYIQTTEFNSFGGKYSDLSLRCQIKSIDKAIEYVNVPTYLQRSVELVPGVTTKYTTNFNTKLNTSTKDKYYSLSEPFCHKGIGLPVFLAALSQKNEDCSVDTNIYLVDIDGSIIDIVGSINPETGELKYTIQPCDKDEIDPINIVVIPEVIDFESPPDTVPDIIIENIDVIDSNDDPNTQDLLDTDGPILPDDLLSNPPAGDGSPAPGDGEIGTGDLVLPILTPGPGGSTVQPPVINLPQPIDDGSTDPIINDPNDYDDLEDYTPETDPNSCS